MEHYKRIHICRLLHDLAVSSGKNGRQPITGCMKHAIPFFVLFLLPLCCGCGERSHRYPPLMERAIGLAESDPDSAIACLDSIDASLQELTEEERMYCHMLRIKAEDKLYIPHTSDSLINRIVRFYKRQGDDRRLAEALYYKAGVYRDCNEPLRAIRTYLSAAEVACEHDTLNGRIYGQLAALYAYQKAYHESMKALRQALVYNIKCDNYLGIAYSWRDMARIFDRQYSPDSAEVYYRKAYNLMKEKGFTEPAYGVLSEWADFKYENGRTEQAKDMAYEVLSHRFYSLSALILAKSYQAENRPDSAEAYCRKVLQGNDIYHRPTAYGILKEIALSQGKQEDAHRYARCYREVSDSISRMTRTEATVRINHEAEKLDLLSHMKRLRHILVLALILLVTGIIYMGRNIRARRKEPQKDEAHIITENQHEEENLTPSTARQSFAAFLSVTRSSELTDEYWQQLTEAINKAYPDFTSTLYQYYPKLSSHELRVCCLAKIGMSRTQMAELLSHSVSSISNTLSRLYTKITGEKGSVQKMTEFLYKLV